MDRVYCIVFSVIFQLNIRESELLEKFLASGVDETEVFLSDSYSPVDSPAVINMSHAYFTYDMNTRIPILQDMNFTVPTGTVHWLYKRDLSILRLCTLWGHGRDGLTVVLLFSTFLM